MALVLQRALTLLKLFTALKPEIGLSEAARLSGESKATVYRLLRTLCDSGLVELVEARKTYRLGPAVLELARVREATVPLLSVVQPVLDQLLEETGETCHFSRFNGASMTVLASAEGRKVNRITMQAVVSLPVCTTAAGQVFLAHATRETVAEILSQDGNRETADTEMVGRLRRIREQGFAVVERFENEDIFGLACPVLGRDGGYIGSLAVITPPNRLTEERFKTLLSCIQDKCAYLEERLIA